MEDDDRAALNEQMSRLKGMRVYIATHAKVLGTTPINACTTSYFEFFRPTVIIGDKMNRCLVVAVLIHYEAPTIILVGNPQYLKPVVVGLTP